MLHWNEASSDGCMTHDNSLADSVHSRRLMRPQTPGHRAFGPTAAQVVNAKAAVLNGLGSLKTGLQWDPLTRQEREFSRAEFARQRMAKTWPE